jgi:hypothetical protein
MRYKNQSSPGDVVIAGTGVITPTDLARRMGVVINDYDETLTTPQKRDIKAAILLAILWRSCVMVQCRQHLSRTNIQLSSVCPVVGTSFDVIATVSFFDWQKTIFLTVNRWYQPPVKLSFLMVTGTNFRV